MFRLGITSSVVVVRGAALMVRMSLIGINLGLVCLCVRILRNAVLILVPLGIKGAPVTAW